MRTSTGKRSVIYQRPFGTECILHFPDETLCVSKRKTLFGSDPTTRSPDRNNIHFKCTWPARLYTLSFKRNRNRPREHITSQGQRGFVFVRLSYAHSTLPVRAIKTATNALLVYFYDDYNTENDFFLETIIIIIPNVYLSKPFTNCFFFFLFMALQFSDHHCRQQNFIKTMQKN